MVTQSYAISRDMINSFNDINATSINNSLKMQNYKDARFRVGQ